MEQAGSSGRTGTTMRRGADGRVAASRAEPRVAEPRAVARRCTAGVTPCASAGTTLWGSLEAGGAFRDCAGWKEIGCWSATSAWLDECCVALTVGGLSQRKVVDWVRRFLGGTLSPATMARSLEQRNSRLRAAQRADPAPAISCPRGGWNYFALSAERFAGRTQRGAAGSGGACAKGGL